MLRHTLFVRGQLPMPYHQLLKVLDEREEHDSIAQQKAAAAAAAASTTPAAAARISGDVGAVNEGAEVGGGGGGRGGRGGPRGAATAGGRSRGTRAKSRRPLAKASAHRRARKCVGVLEETALVLEEAFADATGKGRPVLEALVLFGASHLSPREIYSVTFAEPSPNGSPTGEGNRGRGGVQGKSSLAEAYSRKLVRSVVGEMSSVAFRGLGSCRVHLLLRVADAPVFANPNANAATGSSSSSNNGRGSGTKTPNDDGTNAARLPHPTLALSCAPPSTPLAATTALQHLVPRPGFKIRVSRSRPAPKVSVVLSQRPPAPPSNLSQPPSCSGAVGGHERDGCRGPLAATDEGQLPRGGVGKEGFMQQPQQHGGVWHQLVCPRLVGLKGCDSLAG
eukprot:g4226.t1